MATQSHMHRMRGLPPALVADFHLSEPARASSPRSHELLLLARELAAFLTQLDQPTLSIQLRLEPDSPPVLRIGRQAQVYLQAGTGGYVFALARPGAAPVALELGRKTDLFDVVAAHLLAQQEGPPGPAGAAARLLVGSTVAEIERAAILATLAQCNGNRSKAAGVLGLSLRTVRNKLRLYKSALDDTDRLMAKPDKR